MAGGWPGSDGPARAQLSALRSLLVLSMLLTQQDSQASIFHFVVNAVESLGPFRTYGIFLDGAWQEVRFAGQRRGSADLPDVVLSSAGGPMAAGLFQLERLPWSWAFSLTSPHGPSGYLVVGSAKAPTKSEQFLLQVLAQQTGAALANARLHGREREQASDLRAANSALQRTLEIHDRLTRVAMGGEGQEGIARAVYELTARPVAIEDRFGNLQAWAGCDRPDPYPKADPDRRERLLDRIIAAGSPVRDGTRLVSVALLGLVPVAVLVLGDPDGTAGDTERVAVEHATTVLAMEVARLQSLAETERRMRANLVLDLIAGNGTEGPEVLYRAQAADYDLRRPHRVVVVRDGHDGDAEIDVFLHAVDRAAQAVRVGSLLAPRLQDVIVLADTEAPWERFRSHVVAGLHGGHCRIGVGGRCTEPVDFPRSYQEAQLALRIQRAIGGPGQVTVFDELGVYKVLAAANDTSAMQRFVTEWLGSLIEYDSVHGTQLILTLGEYLDCGGSYDASAKALSVHRSTLKYRLKRIRQVSGYDLGLPDTQFNLQLATRAWRTLNALR